MAIGNLTSQLFANFYLAEFDSWMMSKGIKYGRYVDDLLIIIDYKGFGQNANFISGILKLR